MITFSSFPFRKIIFFFHKSADVRFLEDNHKYESDCASVDIVRLFLRFPHCRCNDSTCVFSRLLSSKNGANLSILSKQKLAVWMFNMGSKAVSGRTFRQRGLSWPQSPVQFGTVPRCPQRSRTLFRIERSCFSKNLLQCIRQRSVCQFASQDVFTRYFDLDRIPFSCHELGVRRQYCMTYIPG